MGKRSSRDISCCYVVRWPDGVVKVGITERQRYKSFVARGGQVVALAHGRCIWSESEAEERGQLYLGARFPMAFRDRDEAVPSLGSRGGGWMECYRASLGYDLSHLVAMLASITSKQCTDAKHRHTDIHTDRRSSATREEMTLSNAREQRRSP
jgi:hypothetical protein